MKSDDVAKRLVEISWDHVDGDDGPMSSTFFGLVLVGGKEIKRFTISPNDYRNDKCAPCESYAKTARNEVAKILREEYGE